MAEIDAPHGSSQTAKRGAARVAFFGTPEFALPTLEMLQNHPLVDLALVCTQPDQPAGRGKKLTAPPAKRLALEYGVAVEQPVSLKGLALDTSGGERQLRPGKRNREFVETINRLGPWDLFVCVAYGKLIPKPLLELPRCGMVNIHPSALPRWRGAAPLQRTVFHGDRKSAVALMAMVEELDAGPVYCAEEFELAPDETYGSLHDRTAKLGAELLGARLSDILSGQLKPVAQSTDGLTYAEKWQAEDLRIDWSEPAEVTLRRIRACSPAPGAHAAFRGERIKIFSAAAAENLNYPAAGPGEIVEVNKREIIVACGAGEFFSLQELQLPGKKRLPARELLRGFPVETGECFS